MPFAILKSIFSVSSEDSSHPASNLLKNESGKKWKTSCIGEKSCYVIFQLENEVKITGVDIGNEHSAFVEVLVGRTKKSDVFTELILTSSFMTPIESKNSDNVNRVRCFDKNRLIEKVADEKWNLVKFVCTQPFNKHCRYGLSFVKIHVVIETKDQNLVPEKFLRKSSTDERSSILGQKNFTGKFKLREDSPDSESESSISLFNRWKSEKTPENVKNKNISSAAAIREASNSSALKQNSDSLKPTKILQKLEINNLNDEDDDEIKKTPILDRNRNDLFYDENDDKPNDKFDHRISLDQERISKQKEEQKNYKKQKDKSLHSSSSSPKVNKKGEETSSHYNTPRNLVKKRQTLSPPQTESPAKKLKNEKDFVYKPFHKLLEGIVFAISGIQNPDRADIRSKALALGAKYKADWDRNCSHLICAFKNTPKYLQVQQENGKIVKRTWIEKCHAQKKHLPWRRFALDSVEADKPESDEEILDISMKPSSSSSLPPIPRTVKSPKNNFIPVKSCSNENRNESEDETFAQYDLEDDNQNIDTAAVISSGSDTEEEIEKIRQKEKNAKPPKSVEKFTEIDIYDQSTEEDEYTKKRKEKIRLEKKDFFKNTKFYLNSELNAIEKIKLQGIIETFCGNLTDSMNQSNFVVTTEVIETSSKFHGQLVKPLWLYECNDMEEIIPSTRYLLK